MPIRGWRGIPYWPSAVQAGAGRWAALLRMGLEAWQTCLTHLYTYSMHSDETKYDCGRVGMVHDGFGLVQEQQEGSA